MNETVSMTITDQVADVRLTRSDKMNALNPEMFRAIGETIDALASRTDVRCVTVSGEGNGPIAALVDAIRHIVGNDFDVVDYHEHSIGRGADATAVAYVETIAGDAATRWGIGTDHNIITASLRAVLCAAGRISE